MKRTWVGVASLGFIAAGVFANVRDAQACGGCFAPPGETPTVVTDHRMILSLSPEQTTLYDQIQYSGSPESFAWVLPISGEAKVGLSSEALFGALDAQTQVFVQAPLQNCPTLPDSCPQPLASAGAERSADGSGVDILKREVVGPYETVQLHPTDTSGNALLEWLEKNKFTLPEDIKPVVRQYAEERFDFLALKLVPGAGINAMRPVRVTTPGASPILPLRMVAAGTGAKVGITLWVVSEGRYEPRNFPSFVIESKDLIWDWTTSSSNYRELRESRSAASEGRAWETESSIQLERNLIESALQNGCSFTGRGGGVCYPTDEYDPTGDSADGGAAPNPASAAAAAEQARREDVDALFKGIPSYARVTRLRSDLSRTALTADLQLQASSSQEVLSQVRIVVAEKNEPQCPVFSGCEVVRQAPRSEAVALSQPGSFACATPPRASGHGLSFGVLTLAGLVGLGAHRAKRRRALNR